MITFNKLGNYGRVGNQMFQIAGTIGVAIKNGYDFAFPEWKNYDDLTKFHSKEDIEIQKFFKNPLPRIPENNFPELNVKWGYHNLNVSDNISLFGYFQSEKYFMHCRDLIRHYFEMVDMGSTYMDFENGIMIHVRRGDFDNNYHPRIGMEYYSKALEQFPSTSPLYVFSDDMKEAREMFGSNATYMEGHHYMYYLYLMCQFKNFIIANSSFSWWPAWLCNAPDKKVIAPSNWFGPMKNISPAEIYCNDWKII
jgi:hypothetical protein